MSKKRKVKLALLERDSYRCGIHLGGCGKILTLKKTTIDHIIPQNINRTNGPLGTLKESLKKQTRILLEVKLFGLQPMCHNCNNVQKQGGFPPTEIVKHCPNECCRFIYLMEGDARYFLHYTHNLSRKDQNRPYRKGDPVKINSISQQFYLQRIQINYSNGTSSEHYIQVGTSRDGSQGFSLNRFGGKVSKSDMMINNAKYSEQEIQQAKEEVAQIKSEGLL